MNHAGRVETLKRANLFILSEVVSRGRFCTLLPCIAWLELSIGPGNSRGDTLARSRLAPASPRAGRRFGCYREPNDMSRVSLPRDGCCLLVLAVATNKVGVKA